MRYRIIAILLLVAVISSSFSRCYVYAGFELNKAYIVKELCENRARPIMRCQGKCYLKKKIKVAEDKEQEAKEKLSRLEVSFYQEPFKLALSVPIVSETKKLPVQAYGYLYANCYLKAVFKPPRFFA